MTSLEFNKDSDKQTKSVDGLTVNDRRDVVLSELKRKSKIRTIFKECPSSEMEEMLVRLKSVYEEKLAEEALHKEKQEKLQRKAQNILMEMEEQGIDVELLREMQLKQHSLTAELPKVKYIKDGATWSGLGRRPTPFKGLSDFELEKYRKYPTLKD